MLWPRLSFKIIFASTWGNAMQANKHLGQAVSTIVCHANRKKTAHDGYRSNNSSYEVYSVKLNRVDRFHWSVINSLYEGDLHHVRYLLVDNGTAWPRCLFTCKVLSSWPHSHMLYLISKTFLWSLWSGEWFLLWWTWQLRGFGSLSFYFLSMSLSRTLLL